MGDIVSHPGRVVAVSRIKDICDILQDPYEYPSPVRAVGSNHSTTRCAVADGGTVIEMGGLANIGDVEPDPNQSDIGYVTAEAGALYLDIARRLQAQGWQFFINTEIGNLSAGSAACGGTKDASMYPLGDGPAEFGQVSSYVVAVEMVLPSGDVETYREGEDPEMMRLIRSSYGLLGVIVNVTFKICRLKVMEVRHEGYGIDEFVRKLPQLRQRRESMMYFMMPFLDSVVVEYRKYVEGAQPVSPLVWRLRNWVWKTVAPATCKALTLIPVKRIRYFLIDHFNRFIRWMMELILRSRATSPPDQIIRYPERAGFTGYTFSLYAFPEEDFGQRIQEYYDFVKTYYRDHGYRCNMINAGYWIAKDDKALLSYSFEGNVMTLDPVSTRNPGWVAFVDAYNRFCCARGGKPIFNQSAGIDRTIARWAYGTRLDEFERARHRFDPDERLLNDYFRVILGHGPP
jgi:FAD/FMN-containing dehydrogenase